MAKFKLKGTDFLSGTAKVGRIHGSDILDKRNRKIGTVKRDKILDARGKVVGKVSGRNLNDERNHKLASISDIQKQIDGPCGEATAAALWMFFMR